MTVLAAKYYPAASTSLRYSTAEYREYVRANRRFTRGGAANGGQQMTCARLRTVFLGSILVMLSVVASVEAIGGASIGEPGLVPLSALGGVVGALVLALLIVAAVRRADR